MSDQGQDGKIPLIVSRQCIALSVWVSIPVLYKSQRTLEDSREFASSSVSVYIAIYWEANLTWELSVSKVTPGWVVLFFHQTKLLFRHQGTLVLVLCARKYKHWYHRGDSGFWNIINMVSWNFIGLMVNLGGPLPVLKTLLRNFLCNPSWKGSLSYEWISVGSEWVLSEYIYRLWWT